MRVAAAKDQSCGMYLDHLFIVELHHEMDCVTELQAAMAVIDCAVVICENDSDIS